MLGIQSRKTKTAVFSGTSKHTQNTSLLRLEELCLNILKDNYMYITYLGNVPYYLIKPVLQKCNPDHLFRLEDFNPDLITEDDELWEAHCNSDFKNKFPSEDESWRELYIRLKYERELKLKSITAHINRKSQKATPVRKTKLAFVESVPKPPRGIKRAQELNGTKYAIGPHRFDNIKGSASASKDGSSTSIKHTLSSSSSVPIIKRVKKTAPLMRKSLDMMKSRFRR